MCLKICCDTSQGEQTPFVVCDWMPNIWEDSNATEDILGYLEEQDVFRNKDDQEKTV